MKQDSTGCFDREGGDGGSFEDLVYLYLWIYIRGVVKHVVHRPDFQTGTMAKNLNFVEMI